MITVRDILTEVVNEGGDLDTQLQFNIVDEDNNEVETEVSYDDSCSFVRRQNKIVINIQPENVDKLKSTDESSES